MHHAEPLRNLWPARRGLSFAVVILISLAAGGLLGLTSHCAESAESKFTVAGRGASEPNRINAQVRNEGETGEVVGPVVPIDTGHALEFTGFDSYVEVDHIPFDELDAFTIEAWVLGWSQRLVYQGKEGDPENSVWLTWGSPGWSIGWEHGDGLDDRYRLEKTSSDRWEHIALVFDGTTQYVFVDGRKVHEMKVPKPGPLVKDRKLLIGAQENWDDSVAETVRRNGTGYLAALRISSKAIYTAPFTPPARFSADKSTELCYDLSRKDDKTLFDLSAKKRHGTLHNLVWIPRSRVK